MMEQTRFPLPSTTTFVGEGPRPLTREVTEQEPYPVENLGDLQSVAVALQDHTRAPIAICAQSILGALSLVLQPHADVVLPTGAASPLSLFLLTIAESGERKSAVDRLALKAVYTFEEELRMAHREEAAAYALDREMWSAKQSQALGEMRKAKKSIDAEADLRALGEEPQPPLTPLLVCPEPTFEGYCRLTAGGRPALGLFSDEGGAFIGGFGMSADNRLKTASCLSKLWDGDAIKRVRAGEGTMILAGRRLALHLMAQSQVADQLLGDDLLRSQGLLSRLLVTAPPSAAGSRFFKVPSEQAKAILAQYHGRLATLLAEELPIPEGTRNELEPRRLRLSEGAEQIWINLHDFVEERLSEGEEFALITGVANKAPEHAARIAGLLTLWADIKAHEVHPDAMANACLLVRHYLAEMLRLAEEARISQHLKLAERVRVWLLEKWSEPAVHLAAIYNDGPVAAVRNRKVALGIVNTLVEHGWLHPAPQHTIVKGAQRKDAWIIHGRTL